MNTEDRETKEQVVDCFAVNRVIPSLPSVTERYFRPRFIKSLGGRTDEDHCILFHSNKICLVTLAPSHPIIKEKKTLLRIDFQVTDKLNRLKNKVSGRWKKGGQVLKENSPLCTIYCEDESEYTVFSGVHGTLVEVNERLLTEPSLLVNKPWSEGYIAIVLPRLGKSDSQKDKMLTTEEYFQSR